MGFLDKLLGRDKADEGHSQDTPQAHSHTHADGTTHSDAHDDHEHQHTHADGTTHSHSHEHESGLEQEHDHEH